jgi:hypothetical protein
MMVRGGPRPRTLTTGQWDDDANTRFVHDWAVERLCLNRQLDHLLADNTMRGFRKGLDLSFTNRTWLTELLQRVKLGKVSVVYCPEVDCLARDP